MNPTRTVHPLHVARPNDPAARMTHKHVVALQNMGVCKTHSGSIISMGAENYNRYHAIYATVPPRQ